jgi:outer membrane receptor protein involved in Fe transport
MSRSRRRKLLRLSAKSARRNARIGLLGGSVASVLAVAPLAIAQEQTEASGGLEEIIVTAQKRAESLQDVPLSITALGNERLDQLRLTDFDDIAKFLPSLSYTTGGPGFSRVYFRGVAAGDNGNHSGSQPSVGIYLDEQPITTIQGALDLHLYDIARVEALAGPQGTLYGASSQSGTVRYITNRPQIGEFVGGYDIEGSTLRSGTGGSAEGFVNIPITDNAAVRLVGWYKKEPGYIDNIAATRTYPTAGITIDNDPYAKDDYNDATTFGARAALRVDLNERWTLTPTIMAQEQKSRGAFAFDPSVGDLQVERYRPESGLDRFSQIALTVEGKIGNLDLVYSGAYLNRRVNTESDYSDYSFFYDQLFYYVVYNDNGDVIDPSQYIQGRDKYARFSHEIRLTSPADQRLRYVAGLFFQRQRHDIFQNYKIDNLLGDWEVSGYPDTIWLTNQQRVDRDSAAFGELTFDFNDQWTGLIGARFFKAENTLEGYFGFGDGFSSSGNSGEALCSRFVGSLPGDRSRWLPFQGAPCLNLDRKVDEDGVSAKVNITYRFDEGKMAYFTYSEGFRPGGVNRRGTFPPYDADYLDNFEIGWKTTWADNRVRLNGALFWQDWADFQFSFLGLNGLTNIINAGDARIKGVEVDLNWAATDNLTLSGSVSLIDSELTEFFCEQLLPDGSGQLPAAQCPADSAAPAGTELPIAPKFKGNLIGRYTFPIGNFDGHVQASVSYEGERRSALLPSDEAFLGGSNSSYSVADIAFGIKNENFSAEVFLNNAFDERAEITRFAQCDESICARPYIITNLPRTFGIKFSQRF